MNNQIYSINIFTVDFYMDDVIDDTIGPFNAAMINVVEVVFNTHHLAFSNILGIVDFYQSSYKIKLVVKIMGILYIFLIVLEVDRISLYQKHRHPIFNRIGELEYSIIADTCIEIIDRKSIRKTNSNMFQVLVIVVCYYFISQ